MRTNKRGPLYGATTITIQDCWIAGCGVLESMPAPVGDEVYSDHPQDCSLDISKVTLCRHVPVIGFQRFTLVSCLYSTTLPRAWNTANILGVITVLIKHFNGN